MTHSEAVQKTCLHNEPMPLDVSLIPEYEPGALLLADYDGSFL